MFGMRSHDDVIVVLQGLNTPAAKHFAAEPSRLSSYPSHGGRASLISALHVGSQKKWQQSSDANEIVNDDSDCRCRTLWSLAGGALEPNAYSIQDFWLPHAGLASANAGWHASEVRWLRLRPL
jgi:hypothetical protein